MNFFSPSPHPPPFLTHKHTLLHNPVTQTADCTHTHTDACTHRCAHTHTHTYPHPLTFASISCCSDCILVFSSLSILLLSCSRFTVSTFRISSMCRDIVWTLACTSTTQTPFQFHLFQLQRLLHSHHDAVDIVGMLACTSTTQIPFQFQLFQLHGLLHSHHDAGDIIWTLACASTTQTPLQFHLFQRQWLLHSHHGSAAPLGTRTWNLWPQHVGLTLQSVFKGPALSMTETITPTKRGRKTETRQANDVNPHSKWKNITFIISPPLSFDLKNGSRSLELARRYTAWWMQWLLYFKNTQFDIQDRCYMVSHPFPQIVLVSIPECNCALVSVSESFFLQMYVYFVNVGSVESLICRWVPSCRLQRKGRRKQGKEKKQRGKKQYLILLSLLTEWLLRLFQLSLQHCYPLL